MYIGSSGSKQRLGERGRYVLTCAGIHLRDLVFIEELETKRNNMVNMEKVQLIAHVLGTALYVAHKRSLSLCVCVL